MFEMIISDNPSSTLFWQFAGMFSNMSYTFEYATYICINVSNKTKKTSQNSSNAFFGKQIAHCSGTMIQKPCREYFFQWRKTKVYDVRT